MQPTWKLGNIIALLLGEAAILSVGSLRTLWHSSFSIVLHCLSLLDVVALLAIDSFSLTAGNILEDINSKFVG